MSEDLPGRDVFPSPAHGKHCDKRISLILTPTCPQSGGDAGRHVGEETLPVREDEADLLASLSALDGSEVPANEGAGAGPENGRAPFDRGPIPLINLLLGHAIFGPCTAARQRIEQQRLQPV